MSEWKMAQPGSICCGPTAQLLPLTAMWTCTSDVTSWSPISSSGAQQHNTCSGLSWGWIRWINACRLVSRLVVMCLMKRHQPYIVRISAIFQKMFVWCCVLMYTLLGHHVKWVCSCELGPKFEGHCSNPPPSQPFLWDLWGSFPPLFFSSCNEK